MICSNYTTLKREVVWAASNIAAGDFVHVELLLDSPLFEQIFEYLSDNDYRVRKEAFITINNCVSGTKFEVCNKIVSKGVIKPLLDAIAEINTVPLILVFALDTIKFILLSGKCFTDIGQPNPFVNAFYSYNVVEILEKFQINCKDSDISNMSLLILNAFFKDIDERENINFS